MSIHIRSQKDFERHRNRTLQKKEECKKNLNALKTEIASSHAEISSSHVEISSLRAELAAEVSKRHLIVDSSHQLRSENQRLLTSNRHHQAFKCRLQRDVEDLGNENYHLKRELSRLLSKLKCRNIIIFVLLLMLLCWFLCCLFDLFSTDELVF